MIIQKKINAASVGELIHALKGVDPDTDITGGLEEGVTISFMSDEDPSEKDIILVEIADQDDQE